MAGERIPCMTGLWGSKVVKKEKGNVCVPTAKYRSLTFVFSEDRHPIHHTRS